MTESIQSHAAEEKVISFWKRLLLAVGYISLSVLILPRSYAEVDDVSMIDFLQHNFLVPFMSVSVSRILSFLYSINHQVPWYAFYHWSLLSLSLSLVWQQLLSLRFSKTLKLSILSLFSIVFLAFTTRLTFTYTSILLGGLSFILLGQILYLRLSDTKALSLKTISVQAIFCGCLFSLAFLTRWEGVKSLIFFVPFLLFCVGYGLSKQIKVLQLTWREWFAGKHSRFHLKQIVNILCCFLLPIIVVAVIEKSLPLSVTERQFDQFMHAHEDNIGFGISRIEEHPDFLKKLGWSDTDYKMYKHWLYLDEETFSTHHMELFSALTKPMIFQVIADTARPDHFLMTIAQVLDNDWFKKRQMSFLFLSMMLFVIVMAADRKQLFGLLGITATLLLGSWLMAVFLRFPFRVAGPIFYISALSVLCFPGIGNINKQQHFFSQSRYRKLLCFFIIALAAVPVLETVYQTVQIPIKQRLFLKDYAFLQKITAPNGYVLREPGLINVKWFDPLLADIPLIPECAGGWEIFSPPYYERLSSRGLSKASDLLPWMVNRPNAWLLVKPTHIRTIEQYMLKHYHLKVKLLLKTHLPSNPDKHLYQLTMQPID